MFRKILISFLSVAILSTIEFAIFHNFSNKKVEGVQDINSKIINYPKESENKTQSLNSPNQSSNQNNSVSENKKQNEITNPEQFNNQSSNEIDENRSNSINSSTPVYTTPNYPDINNDFLIKQAEEEARISHKALKNAEECLAFQTARDNALFPIKQEISNLRIEYNNVEDVINEKIKGFDVSESQRIRMVEAEQHRIQLEINQLEAEYDRLYLEWGDCEY